VPHYYCSCVDLLHLIDSPIYINMPKRSSCGEDSSGKRLKSSATATNSLVSSLESSVKVVSSTKSTGKKSKSCLYGIILSESCIGMFE